MFFTIHGTVCDPSLDYLKKHLFLIDAELQSVTEEAKGCDDPDALGVFEELESLLGLGFVACQQYLTRTSSWMKVKKRAALAVGPKHPTGFTIAQIINDAANFWKHEPEWPGDEMSNNQWRKTKLAIEKVIGGPPGDYPVSRVLAKLTNGAVKFKPLLPRLAAWRDELRTNKA
jgi:hypothetical protein